MASIAQLPGAFPQALAPGDYMVDKLFSADGFEASQRVPAAKDPALSTDQVPWAQVPWAQVPWAQVQNLDETVLALARQNLAEMVGHGNVQAANAHAET